MVGILKNSFGKGYIRQIIFCYAVEIWRTYSISGTPTWSESITFETHITPQGAFLKKF